MRGLKEGKEGAGGRAAKAWLIGGGGNGGGSKCVKKTLSI